MTQRYRFAAIGPDGYHAGGGGEGRRSTVQQLYLRALERGHTVTRAHWLAGNSAGCFLCSGGIFSERDGDAEKWYYEHDCGRMACNADASCTVTVKFDEMEPSPLKDIFLAMQAQHRQHRQIIHRAMSAYLFSRGDDAGSKALTEAAALEMYHQFLQERNMANG